MRLTTTCLAVGLAGVFAATVPATAGDLDNSGAGDIRGYNSGGVPVPVPTTYQETFKWYLRGDLGTSFKNSGTLDNGGTTLPLIEPNNWHELSIISLGFGKYLTPSIRAEFTLDYRPDRIVEAASPPVSNVSKTAFLTTNSISYTDPVTGNSMSSGARQYLNNFYSGILDERTTYENTTFLASLYYDFNHGGRWRPYVGAGVGLAFHQLDLNGKGTYNCTGSTITTVPDLVTIPIQTSALQPCDTSSGSPLPTSYTTNIHQNAVGWGLAAQMSAGLTYDVSQRVHWDTGYRFLWQSGRLAVSSADGVSTIRLGDQFNHEVRTGFRWDLW